MTLLKASTTTNNPFIANSVQDSAKQVKLSGITFGLTFFHKKSKYCRNEFSTETADLAEQELLSTANAGNLTELDSPREIMISRK